MATVLPFTVHLPPSSCGGVAVRDYSRDLLLSVRSGIQSTNGGVGIQTVAVPFVSKSPKKHKESEETSQATGSGRRGDFQNRESRATPAQGFPQFEVDRGPSAMNHYLAYASKGSMETSTLWIGPLPLPPNRKDDEEELELMLRGVLICDLHVYNQHAYVTVPATSVWEVRRRILGHRIRQGEKLSARERVDASSTSFVPHVVSPFEVCFSQPSISDHFLDAAPLETTVPQIVTHRGPDGTTVLLPPFKPIRVFSDGSQFVSLDNRRLYVLQRRAAEFWPRPCTVEVLLCKGQVPSDYWAKLATRGPGDCVDVLSCIHSDIGGRWTERPKRSWRWSWEDAVLAVEERMAQQQNGQRFSNAHSFRNKASTLSPSGSPVQSGSAEGLRHGSCEEAASSSHRTCREGSEQRRDEKLKATAERSFFGQSCAEWLSEVDSSGALAQYCEVFEDNFDSVAQVWEAYMGDSALEVLDPAFFEDLGIRDSTHKKTFFMWFARAGGMYGDEDVSSEAATEAQDDAAVCSRATEAEKKRSLETTQGIEAAVVIGGADEVVTFEGPSTEITKVVPQSVDTAELDKFPRQAWHGWSSWWQGVASWPQTNGRELNGGTSWPSHQSATENQGEINKDEDRQRDAWQNWSVSSWWQDPT